MNTTLFIAGMGIGAIAPTALFFYVVLTAVSKANKNSAEVHKTTINLLRDRNATQRNIEGHLRTLAEFCENHWK